MDWSAARSLQDAGMQCGAHSLTHPALADCSPGEARRELVESRERLEDRLGREVTHFAYPYGSVSPQVRALAAEAGYLSACATERRLATVQRRSAPAPTGFHLRRRVADRFRVPAADG